MEQVTAWKDDKGGLHTTREEAVRKNLADELWRLVHTATCYTGNVKHVPAVTDILEEVIYGQRNALCRLVESLRGE